MRQQIFTAVAAVALAAAGATTAIATTLPRAGVQSPILIAADTAPATTKAATGDVKNTLCLVMPDDDVTDGKSVTYKGKTYHLCCSKCVKAFNKDPEKYVKAFDANPAAYGIK